MLESHDMALKKDFFVIDSVANLSKSNLNGDSIKISLSFVIAKLW